MDDLHTFYRKALPERIDEIERALAQGDAAGDTKVRRIAHTLRGSGATYGFPEVTVAAERVEEAAQHELRARAEELVAVLRRVAGGAAPGAAAHGQSAKRSLRVLLVDDDPQIRLIVTHLLTSAGHAVVEAEDTAGADAALAVQCPDVVLMDMMLGAEDGVDAMRALLAKHRESDPRVIFLTGATRADQLERLKAAGATGVIGKPFEPESFIHQFHQLVGAAWEQ